MRKLLFLTFAMAIAILSFECSGQERLSKWPEYENSLVRVGVEGTKLAKVWGRGITVRSAIIQARKNAVHACLITGLRGGDYVMATPPLCDKEEITEHRAYIDLFLNNPNTYKKFTKIITDKVPSGEDILHVACGYKVGVYIQIRYDELRRKLEADGIIRSLNSSF